MSQTGQTTDWICTSCGEKHNENNPPCTSCAGEQFARIVDDTSAPETIDSTETIHWHCTDCGESHMKNNPPCKHCGGMTLEPVRVQPNPTASSTPRQSKSHDYSSPRRVTLPKIVNYLYGGSLTLLGLIGMTNTLAVGVFTFLAGAITLPQFRGRLRAHFNLDFSSGAIVALSLLFLFVSMGLAVA